MNKLGNSYQYSYIHDCGNKVLNIDMPIISTDNYRHLAGWEDAIVQDETLYVNTWFGTKMGQHGINQYNYGSHHFLWKLKVDAINRVLGTDIVLSENIWDYVPNVDDNYIEDINVNLKGIKRVLVSNGPALSGQSSFGDFYNIVNILSEKYKNVDFICTQRLGIEKENIFYTDDILSCSDNSDNILEIVKFSESCDLIVGKNSGPHGMSHTKKNAGDKYKTFIGVSEHDTRMFLNLDGVEAETYHVWQPDESEVLSLMDNVINKKRNVFVNGCFDVLHYGHLELFKYARSLGDYLIVAIDSDSRVYINKGEGRPINNQNIRKEFLESLIYVDEVNIFDNSEELEEMIKTKNIYHMVVGEEYLGNVIGGDYAKELHLFPRIEEFSTSKFIQNSINR